MIPLLLALGGALGIGAASELIPLAREPLPLAWLGAWIASPLLHAAAGRAFQSRFRTAARLLCFLALDAAVTFPLGWARWTLVDLGWWGVTAPSLALLLLPPAALGLAAAPFAYREWRRAPQSTDQGFTGWLWDRLRIVLSPLVLLFTLALLSQVVEESPAYALALERFRGVDAGLAALGLAGAFAASPLFVLLAWRTEPLVEGELKQAFEVCSRRLGVKIDGIRVWDDRSRFTLNACAVGLLPGTRMVIFTKGILRHLGPAEVTSVFSHEAAHLSRKHLAALAALALAFVLSIPPLQAILSGLHDWAQGLSFAVYGALYWIVGLGRVSRRFETEADLAAAGTTGVEAYASALRKAALGTGAAFTRDSWRHPSLASRLQLLERAKLDPQVLESELSHGRRLRRRIGALFLLCLAAFVAAFLWAPPGAEDPLTQAVEVVESLEAFAPVAGSAAAPAGRRHAFHWLARSPEAVASREAQLREQAQLAIEKLRAASPGAAGSLLERMQALRH